MRVDGGQHAFPKHLADSYFAWAAAWEFGESFLDHSACMQRGAKTDVRRYADRPPFPPSPRHYANTPHPPTRPPPRRSLACQYDTPCADAPFPSPPWTDGAPLIFTSELPIARELRGWSLGLIWGAPDFLVRTSYHPRIPRMEPWTDGALLNFQFKLELPITRESDDGASD